MRALLIAPAAVAATLAVSALRPAPAHAFCGFYIDGAGKDMFAEATQVVLMRDGTRTVLSMQNNYQGPTSDFAMVVPVPVVLQKENVKTLTREVFDHVDQLDAPRLVDLWARVIESTLEFSGTRLRNATGWNDVFGEQYGRV